MSCCQPPLALVYLRGLLSNRHDIAVHPAGALEGDTPPGDFYLYRPSEVLVPGAEIGLYVSTARRLGVRTYPIDKAPDGDGDGVTRFAIGANVDLDTVLDRLTRAAHGRLHVTPNHVVLLCPRYGLSPDGDPRPAPALPPAPDEDRDKGVSVAVIDSGLPQGFATNPLLSAVVSEAGDEEGWTYEGTNPVLTFPQGHGSFVAGVVRLAAPEVQIRSYLVADTDGVADEWFLGRQVDLALERQPAVINLSLGTPSRHDESLLGLRRLAAAASSDGGPIVVAAAGNMAMDRPFWPAAERWTISVGAVERAEGRHHPIRAPFSDYGRWVDTCAVGVDVISAYEARPYRTVDGELRYFEGAAVWSGTSFAAPRVAAAAARQRAADPAVSRQDILDNFRAAPGAIEVPDTGVFVP